MNGLKDKTSPKKVENNRRRGRRGKNAKSTNCFLLEESRSDDETHFHFPAQKDEHQKRRYFNELGKKVAWLRWFSSVLPRLQLSLSAQKSPPSFPCARYALKLIWIWLKFLHWSSTSSFNWKALSEFLLKYLKRGFSISVNLLSPFRIQFKLS